jgi:hypothetical protein
VDTGAADLYDLSKAHYATFSKLPIFQERGTSVGGSSIGLFGAGAKEEHARLLLPALKLAGHPFRNVVLETTNDDNSRIGATILKHGLLTLDYKKKRFYFEPFKEETLMDDRARGVSLTSDGKHLLIGLVWEEELKDKLSYGDVVLKIDGKDYDICDIITRREELKKARTVKYLIQPVNGEANFEIELSKKSLLE